ncbi:MAG: hypothetical protein H8D92_02500, partial [Pelagibacteraceae bacterium]|nr:hypothetical protein [Pelagibacteraceae bacterium]
ETFMAKSLLDGELVEGEWNELADIMGRAKLFGVDTSRAIEFIRDQMSKSAAKLSDSWQKFQAASVRGGVGIHATKLEPAKKEIAKYRTDTSGGWGSPPPAGTGESINATRSSSSYAAQALKNITQQASATNTRTQINSLQSAIDSGRFVGKTGHEQEQLLKALITKSHVGVSGQALLNKAQRAIDNGQVKSGSDKEARKHAAAFSAAMTLYNMNGGEKPQMGDLTNIVNGKPSGSQGYANGGLITEPIFGIGRSGQTYTFGERGQETVTPGRGGTNYTLNINVGNVTREADFDKLKPLIQRWILEANSRRGVV